MNESFFGEFTNKFNVSKTLRFELRPVGKTEEKIKESRILEQDELRSEYYPRMKEILDNGHKALLQEALSAFEMTEEGKRTDWKILEQAYDAFQKDKDKKALETVSKKYRSAITRIFKKFLSDKNSPYYKLAESTPSDFIKNVLKNSPDEEDRKILEAFNEFACYFKGFQENRKNIYSAEAQTTAAANRAVNENFPKFLECVRIFKILQSAYPELIERLQTEMADHLHGRDLADIFDVRAYGKVLAQSGIDDFNAVIGGIKTGETVKIRGMNEFINKYRQDHPETDQKLPLMPLLYKQILSDRERLSFIPTAFSSDEEVVKSVLDFGTMLERDAVAEKMKSILNTLSDTDEGIYINGTFLAEVSRGLFGAWDVFERAQEELEAQNKSKRTKRPKKETYSLAELYGISPNAQSVSAYWKSDKNGKIFADVSESFDCLKASLKTGKTDVRLSEQSEIVQNIKTFLDSVLNLMHFVKPLNVKDEANRNRLFYEKFDGLFEALDTIVPLYNRVRDYVTKKPTEAKKLKLMFDCPTLADGWDLNKEKDNKSVLFTKDGKYYLGIINKNSERKPNFDAMAKRASGKCYKKMVYKYIPDPNKMFPKVFFSKKGMETYHPSEDLVRRYENGEHKKGETFDLAFCRELIDYFKESIFKNPDWNVFDFHFSDTSAYKDIGDFYREVSRQAYKLKFVDVSEADINASVENGELFLFQIRNKDFADRASGRKNMHTLYWEHLFSDENRLKNYPVKLNGEAELFFRPASVKKTFVHKVGEKMLNKRDKDGNPVPESIYKELFEHVNGRLNKPLSKEAAEYADKIVVKDVTHSITKDKRFTEDKYFFHVPMTINRTAGDPVKFNESVNEFVKAHQHDFSVIGIDRGERNLIYAVLINAAGEITEQKSFNVVNKTDYHQKLDEREKQRDAARKSWKSVARIKDLKEGYLSGVVHEITKMMVKHNAVAVLENLNYGFKRGRFRIEKQVYQKFEKALIDKLNYLVFKENDPCSFGGVLNGYQLTDRFKSFEKIGKQTGFLYYVPAAYTSKIDPTTGFVNLFDLKSCTNAEKIKAFFDQFDSVSYCEKYDAFAFAFDYGNFKTLQQSWKTQWTVYSGSERLVYNNASKITETVFPTKLIKDALMAAGATLSDGYDLKKFMSVLNPSKKQDASFFLAIFRAFKLSLQMRNSNAVTGEDYIVSPILNKDGVFFDSRTASAERPRDADANGAFHIALKGLFLIQNMNEKGGKIEHKDWFEFVQKRCR